jgi:SagB-type dehydrogenase family enzyme
MEEFVSSVLRHSSRLIPIRPLLDNIDYDTWGRRKMNDGLSEQRRFLKSNWHLVKEAQSDQAKGIPVPPQELPVEPDDSVISLPPPESVLSDGARAGLPETGSPLQAGEAAPSAGTRARALHYMLANRKSRRSYRDAPVSLSELSFLLWSCEGIKQNKGKYSFRTVPSGGARHPLDLYVFAHKVEGIPVGLYRYLPVEHALVREREGDDSSVLDEALEDQFWNSACVFLWAAVPYRSEWRYGKAAEKLIALDAGHSCQNLYLACEALGLGTCAVGAYDQEKLDRYLGLDGEDMFALYAAPIGWPKTQTK